MSSAVGLGQAQRSKCWRRGIWCWRSWCWEIWRWGILLGGLGLLGLSGCRDRPNRLTPPPQATGRTLNSPAAEHQPHLSYDGRYLVFSSDRRAQRQVYLYDIRRRQLIPLPGLNAPGSFVEQPAISADGRYIVYVSQQYGKPDVFVYDRQTLNAQVLTREFRGEVRRPTISGNGRVIAFESNRSGQWDIEIIDRGGAAPPSLPPANAPNGGNENSGNENSNNE
ncbi:MAG: TolB family protein [Spirulinaceae cyanobacterium]